MSCPRGVYRFVERRGSREGGSSLRRPERGGGIPRKSQFFTKNGSHQGKGGPGPPLYTALCASGMPGQMAPLIYYCQLVYFENFLGILDYLMTIMFIVLPTDLSLCLYQEGCWSPFCAKITHLGGMRIAIVNAHASELNMLNDWCSKLLCFLYFRFMQLLPFNILSKTI